MSDIHNYRRRVETRLKALKTEDISECNKELISKFLDDCYSDRLTEGRIYKHLYHLIRIVKFLNKDLDKADIEDIKKLIRDIESFRYGKDKPYTEHTKKDFRISIKKFYKWLNGGKTCPEHVNWITLSIKNHRKKLPEELLTQDDVKQMIKAADNPRDKALLFTLYESGCRIGEMLDLKLKHIQFDKYGVQLIVNGKTGSRRVRIILACDYLKYWYENHPDRTNPEAYLWVNMATNKRGYKIAYPSIAKRIKEIAMKAGIKKKVNPHNFRHSRATYLANRLTEPQLCQIFGWTLSSRMPATYVHMSGRDVDNALLKIYGIKENGDDEIITCPRCKSENKPIAKYCNNCGIPFNLETAMSDEEERSRYDDMMSKLMEEMLKDPEIKKKMKNIIQNLK